MRTLLLLLFVAALGYSACAPGAKNTPPDYSASKALSEEARALFLKRIVRYMGRLAPGATDSTRFDPVFDEHYEKVLRQHRLDFYFADEKSGDVFFMASRIAPSIREKFVGVGGKLRLDADGGLTHYEEIFRTWKMERPLLEERGGLLFHLMVTGQDLSPYYPQTSKEEYIEFPDPNTYYDARKRVWVSKLEDPLKEFKEEAQRKRDSLLRANAPK